MHNIYSAIFFENLHDKAMKMTQQLSQNFLLVESDIKLLNSEERLEEELGAKKWEIFQQKNHNSDKRSRINILQR